MRLIPDYYSACLKQSIYSKHRGKAWSAGPAGTQVARSCRQRPGGRRDLGECFTCERPARGRSKLAGADASLSRRRSESHKGASNSYLSPRDQGRGRAGHFNPLTSFREGRRRKRAREEGNGIFILWGNECLHHCSREGVSPGAREAPAQPTEDARGTERERRRAVRGWLSSSQRQRRSLVPLNDPKPGSASGWGSKKYIFFLLLEGARQSFIGKKNSKRAARRNCGCRLAPVSWGVGSPLLPGPGTRQPGGGNYGKLPSLPSPQRRVALSRGLTSPGSLFPATTSVNECRFQSVCFNLSHQGNKRERYILKPVNIVITGLKEQLNGSESHV
ncbi:uncharacterized protein [Anomalospiza imberbis]|uniref:uncharacterized protein n=1 Tax=Anomalospiza imberbis TaxID=187417 RepID=UPI00358F3A19